jgi:hypothetical protein
MRRCSIVLLLFAAILAPVRAQARPLAQPLDLPPNQLALEVGAAPSLGIELSYSRRFSIGRTRLVPAAALGVPFATAIDGRTWNAELGAAWIAPLWRGLGLTANLAATLRSARNPQADLVGLGLDVGVQPGWFAWRWYLAADLGLASTLGLHVRHSELARESFEDRYGSGSDVDAEGPRDGWYGATAHRLHAGLTGGAAIRNRVTLGLAAGFVTTVNEFGLVAFPDVGILPFYMRAGVAVSW